MMSQLHVSTGSPYHMEPHVQYESWTRIQPTGQLFPSYMPPLMSQWSQKGRLISCVGGI